MQSCKPVNTHIEKSIKLSMDMCLSSDAEKDRMRHVPYAYAVESLMHAMRFTRLDLAFTVGLVSRYQSNPRMSHWNAIKRILRYLRGTHDYMLFYQGSDLRLRGYSDADWANDPNDRKSTSGFVFMFGGGAIS